jgi:hypothetical protein
MLTPLLARMPCLREDMLALPPLTPLRSLAPLLAVYAAMMSVGRKKQRAADATPCSANILRHMPAAATAPGLRHAFTFDDADER